MSFLFLYYRKGFQVSFYIYIYTVNTPHNSSEDDEAKCIGERTQLTPDDVYFKRNIFTYLMMIKPIKTIVGY